MRKFDTLFDQKMKLYEAAIPAPAPVLPAKTTNPATPTPTAPAPVAGTAPAATTAPVAPAGTTPATATAGASTPSQVNVNAQNLPDILGKIQKDPALQKALADYLAKQTPATPAQATPAGTAPVIPAKTGV